MERLQGREWTEYKKNHRLRMVAMMCTSHGNYKAIVMNEDGDVVQHYLSDSEADKLKGSGWLDTNKVYSPDELYAGKTLRRLCVQCRKNIV